MKPKSSFRAFKTFNGFEIFKLLIGFDGASLDSHTQFIHELGGKNFSSEENFSQLIFRKIGVEMVHYTKLLTHQVSLRTGTLESLLDRP